MLGEITLLMICVGREPELGAFWLTTYQFNGRRPLRDLNGLHKLLHRLLQVALIPYPLFLTLNPRPKCVADFLLAELNAWDSTGPLRI